MEPAGGEFASLIDRGVRELVYTHDMADDWRRTITIETVGLEPAIDYPRFVDGARRCPPEDFDGLPGFLIELPPKILCLLRRLFIH